MKINPWIVVTLLALACGYLVGARTENEAEAEAPRYQYFFNPEAPDPIKAYNEKIDGAGRYTRVDLNTGMFEELKAGKFTKPKSKAESETFMFIWSKQWDSRTYQP